MPSDHASHKLNVALHCITLHDTNHQSSGTLSQNSLFYIENSSKLKAGCQIIL